MNKNLVIILVVVIMAAVGVWKYQNSSKSNVVVEQKEQELAQLDPMAPVVTDNGVLLPDAAKSSVIKEVTDEEALGKVDGEAAKEEKIVQEDIIESSNNVQVMPVYGPNTLPRAECLEKYKNSAREIAMYVGGKDDSKDYLICHALAENDISYCSSGSKACEELVSKFSYIYQVMAEGKYDINECAVAYSNVKIPGWSMKRLCNGITSVLKGEADPPDQFSDEFLFMSGRTSSCAELKKNNKYSCFLLADMVSGIQTGANRFYLYDALSKKDCSKTDNALVERYCSNKIK